MNCVFLDIDTQNDFIHSDGALYVPGAEKLIDIYDEISVYALDNEITILASADAHDENDSEFSQFPPHCVKNTEGQKKIKETLPEIFFVQPNDGKKVKKTDLQKSNVLFEKQTFDVFSNPKIETYLNFLLPKQVVVYGVATDYCVKAAVEGLLQRKFPVLLLTDAIRAVDSQNEQKVLDELAAKGAQLGTFDHLVLSRE